MATLSYRSAPDRRYAALALTALVHALLLLGWQATRRLPALDARRDARRIQWINLAPAERQIVPPARAQAPERMPTPEPVPVHAPVHAPVHPLAPAMPAAPAVPAVSTMPADPAASAAASSPAAPAQTASDTPLLQRALREAGAADRSLRKENRPYLVAPPDSPQIRLRNGIEEAHAMAPNAWYQAPRIDELVNNTGDGARRTRVITGNGTYCVTNRAPTSSIDTIEILGKQRFTNCPAHESTASSQEWKTARDP